MNDMDSIDQLVEDRRLFLQLLAEPRKPSVDAGRTRQRFGQLMIRFGEWVEGRCPEVVVERSVTGTYRSA